MTERKQEQLNQDPLSLGYFRSPYALMRLGLPEKVLRIASVIYSYSNVKRRPDAKCAMSRRKLADSAGASRSTANRAVRLLEDLKGIEFEQEKEDAEGHRLPCSKYSLKMKGAKGAVTHFRFLQTKTFDMKDGRPPRKLKGLEESIVSVLLTNATNPKAKKGFDASYESMANLLGRSKDGVEKAIGRLLRAGVIHRPRKGTSKHRKSRYIACRELRLMAGKEIEEEKQQVPAEQPAYKRTKAEIDADARTERDRHYQYLRDAAQARADANRERAESDGEYSRIHREIRGLEPAIERARHDGTMATAEQLARRRKALKVQEARILSRLGLTAADLEPKWNCPICHDTGFRIKDGKMCDCWRPPRRSS